MVAPLTPTPRNGLSRRTILVGGGAGVGLAIAWGVWPRSYAPNLVAGPGETIVNAFLKIGADGRVTVIVPQAEMGQGVWTALPQALADELGADWRQIGVEPAPISPLYANTLLLEEGASGQLPGFLGGVGRWAAREYATRNALMMTAGSSSIRGFEQRFREAGAAARALLCMAAGARLGADWRACDTEAGFVVRGEDRIRFGELAAEAAGYTPPDPLPLRTPGEGKLSGQPVSRIDLPAKVDGSARFAGDVRLPNMVHASIRHGPLGDTSLGAIDEKAARAMPGVVGIVRKERWVAALATNWWAADKAVEALAAKFATKGRLPGAVHVAGALDRALASGGETLIAAGDAAKALAGQIVSADYAVPLAPHAAIEPLVATARASGGRVEVWVPTQAQGLTRRAVALATGFSEDSVTIYPMPVGGGFGRKIENDAAVEAALLAIEAKRPVQLMWSRSEEMQRARHRPPAKAKLKAALAGGRIAAWQATVATPAAMGELGQRLFGRGGGGGAELAAIDGGRPPYAIPNVAVAHAPAEIGIETGMWRSVAHSYTAFFGESFMDELAAAANSDPLSFRMGQLAGTPRLARCLTRVTAAGGWSGEAESGQGLAIHSAFGSHIALLAEAAIEDDAIRVTRLVATVDCGRMVNPDIVRQQIEGGLIFGLAAALGDAVTYTAGVIDQRAIADLRLPKLADTPEIAVDLVESKEAPGGVAELAVPVVAPAVANAIASATGRRLRSLPLALA